MIKNPPLIKKIVSEMGGTIKEFIPERGCFYADIEGQHIFISRKFSISNHLIIGRDATKYKDLTYKILREASLPTPETVCFYKKTITEELLNKGLASLTYPVVVKDAQGSNSKGVFANIKTEKEARQLILDEIKNFPNILAQQMVFGKEFRVLILDNKALAVLELIPPRILGDGVKTIRLLIEEKQKNTAKKTPIDSLFISFLEEQGFSLDDIPSQGVEVLLKKSSSLAEGGETRDVTDLISPEIEKICAKASRCVGKILAGIDVICEDISKSPSEQSVNILEINGKPDVYIHYNPTYGETQNVIKKILEYILSSNAK